MRAPARIALVALALSSALLLGNKCVFDPVGIPAGVTLEAGEFYPFGAGYYAEIHVVVNTSHPFQAFDLDIAFDPATVAWAIAYPGEDFDDDGTFFREPSLAAVDGAFEEIVDVRHGAPVMGPTRVATLYLWSPLGGTSVVAANMELADPSGIPFEVAFETDLEIGE